MNQPQTRMNPPPRKPLAVPEDPELPIAAVWTIDELDHSADLESVRSAWAYTDGFSD
jgi:hypothetical protein